MLHLQRPALPRVTVPFPNKPRLLMTMHAIRIHKFGGPEVLQDEVLPVPQAGSGELLVRIEAASVNPVDYKIREGKFAKASDDALPITLGRDLSGMVEADPSTTLAPLLVPDTTAIAPGVEGP